jgi:hypothetical protein
MTTSGDFQQAGLYPRCRMPARCRGLAQAGNVGIRNNCVLRQIEFRGTFKCRVFLRMFRTLRLPDPQKADGQAISLILRRIGTCCTQQRRDYAISSYSFPFAWLRSPPEEVLLQFDELTRVPAVSANKRLRRPYQVADSGFLYRAPPPCGVQWGQGCDHRILIQLYPQRGHPGFATLS